MDKYWEVKKSIQNVNNKEAINEFLVSLKLENNSQGTIVQYRRFLERFFSERLEPFSTLTSDTILKWFHENDKNVKEVTLKFQLSILSSFYNFCVEERYLELSPIKGRWFPRLPKAIPKYLEKGDIAKTRQQSEQISLRSQLLVEFLLTSGCRIGEVNQLNKADVDLEERTARVIGKGKKIRLVHFSEKCSVLLERYLDSHPKNTTALFVTSTGKRLSIRRMQEIVNKIGKDANLTTRLYPHRLRHTFATELLTKGADMSFIKDELGHNDITTTQIYARIPKREIITLYRKYMG